MSEELQQWLGTGAGITRRLARVSKHGHPFLYFPTSRSLAVQSLDLYPAQRPAARTARAALRVVCGIGLAKMLPSTRFTFPTESPAIAFLSRVSGSGTESPQLAIIAGNPLSPGRRYILLLYARNGRPSAVVKVGLNDRAAGLILRETAALQAVGSRTTVAPRVLAMEEFGTTRALALEHIAGEAPTHASPEDLAHVLTLWVDTSRSVMASDIPAWHRLWEAAPTHPLLTTMRSRIESAPFHPALYHGDFAPWNVKVQPDGAWRVLDWERGELTGLPCWDWFHYQVQVGLLVDRLDPVAHAQTIHRLLNDRAFLRYATAGNAQHTTRELFLAYLLYSMHIIGPKESLPAKQALLDTLVAQWKSG